MYSKALIPGHNGFPAIPLVIATVPPGDTTVSELHRLGWTPYGGEATNTPSQLSITDRFRLIVDGQELLNDSVNPTGPAGWWEAVSVAGDRAVVVVVEAGHVDLNSPQVGAQLKALIDSDHAAQALVPIAHA
ncbi:hypothetical protein [Glutamicibacter arilaitensis]|uniref:hypothetical protein n=1 Tax=Glutamicibacter arilaitensis TaxID=256701 RepID=UPI003FD118B4